MKSQLPAILSIFSISLFYSVALGAEADKALYESELILPLAHRSSQIPNLQRL